VEKVITEVEAEAEEVKGEAEGVVTYTLGITMLHNGVRSPPKIRKG
jgi:hypothetical protein